MIDRLPIDDDPYVKDILFHKDYGLIRVREVREFWIAFDYVGLKGPSNVPINEWKEEYLFQDSDVWAFSADDNRARTFFKITSEEQKLTKKKMSGLKYWYKQEAK